MSKITITLNDNRKHQELLELVSSLPYVDTITVDEAITQDTEHVTTNSLSNADPLPSDMNGHTLATLPATDVDEDDPLDQEVLFFEAKHEALTSEYLGQYIAMLRGEVVEHHADLETLINKVRKIHPDNVILFRQVQEVLPPTLVFRSPRMESS